MSRIITSGAEWGVTVADVANAPDGKLVQGATPQFNVSATAAYVRSGAFGWRMTPSAAAGNFGYAEFVPTALNFFATTYWFRIYFKRISGTPITAPGDPFFHIYDSTGPFLQLMMDTSGRLVVRNVVAAANALVGGQIDDGQWHRVEVSYNMPSTSGNTTVDCYLDGTRVGTGYSGNMRNLSANGCRLGATAVSSTVLDWALDDFALNDDGGTQQNSRPGDGKIVLLKPIGDTAVGAGWTAGGGATTGLFNAIDNSPPVGVTDPGTNTSQIRNATSTAVANYDATLTSYTTAGIGASDTIQLCQWCINHGTASATSPPVRAVQLTSNPAEAGETTLSSPTAVAGTFPTNWLWQIGPVTYVPTVTKGTSPVMRVGKRTASTRIVDVDAMGLYVEYLPVGGILNKLTISSSLTVSSSVKKKVRKPVTRSVVASPTIVRKARKPINRSMVISPTVVRKAQKSVNRSLAMNLGMNLGKKYSRQISAPLALGGAPAAPYAPAVLADSPLLYWRFQETSGVMLDSSGNGHTGLVSGPGVTRGQPGPLAYEPADKSAQFSGVPETNVSGSVPTWTSMALSVECWFYMPSGNHHGTFAIAGWAGYGIGVGLNDMETNGRNLIGMHTRGWVPTGIPLSDGWHHVVLTVQDTDFRIYLDGALALYMTSFGDLPAADVYAGGWYNPRNFDGSVDEVAIYDHALTPARIAIHWAAGLPLPPDYASAVLMDRPSGYWRLNEISGTAAADLGSGNHAGTYGADVVKGVSPLVTDGKAAYFPGGGALTGSFVHVADPVLPGVDNNFTIEAWLKLAAGETYPGYIVSLGNWNAPSGVSFYLGATGGGSGRSLVAAANGLAWIGEGYTFPDVDVTAHIALVVTTADWVGSSAEQQRWYTFFVNGVQVGQLGERKPGPISDFVDIGGEYYPAYGRRINAVLDEVAVYNTALPAPRLLAHYNAGIGSLPAAGAGGPTLSLKFMRGRAISAGLTIQPKLARKTSRKFSRPLTLSGAVVKKARISRPRALTITSTLVRKPRKSVGAPLSLSVSVGRAKTSRRAISASSALSAALARRVRLTRSRPLTLTGSNVRKLRTSLSRSLVLTASTVRKSRLARSRTIVLSSIIVKKPKLKTSQPLTVGLSVVPRKIAAAGITRLIQVGLTMSPSLKRKSSRKIAPPLVMAMTLKRRVQMSRVRTLTIAPALVRRRFIKSVRTLTMGATISKKTRQSRVRTLTLAASVQKKAAVRRTLTLNLVGSFKRRVGLTRKANLVMGISTPRRIRRVISQPLTFTAQIGRKFPKKITRTLVLGLTLTPAKIGKHIAVVVNLKLTPTVGQTRRISLGVVLKLGRLLALRKFGQKGQLVTRMRKPTILSANGRNGSEILRVTKAKERDPIG